jgi:hypothetical protein
MSGEPYLDVAAMPSRAASLQPVPSEERHKMIVLLAKTESRRRRARHRQRFWAAQRFSSKLSDLAAIQEWIIQEGIGQI